MKKIISVLILASLTFSNILATISLKNNKSNCSHLSEQLKYNLQNENKQFDTRQEVEEISEKIISKIEDFLSERRTSVENELLGLKEYFESNSNFILPNHKDKKSQTNHFTILETLEKMANEYSSFREETIEKTLRGSYITNGHMTDDELVKYTAVMSTLSAVVAYFSNQQYYLAAELLTHMRDNTEIDSIYRPINSQIVLQSSVYNNLGYALDYRGTGTFDSNPSSTSEQDLYLSIHDFYYSKSIHNDAIVITDRYDFEIDMSYDEFFTDSASNMMYVGQTYGFLKPFFTTIEGNNEININTKSNYISLFFSDSEDWQYKDYQLTLGQDDWVFLCFTFESSSVWTIQTLGDKDTEIFLYSGNGSSSLYCSDDDSGYEYNSLINHYFFGGQEYILLVQFYYPTDIGNVKIIFTPSDITNYDSIPSIERTDNFWTQTYQNIPDQSPFSKTTLFTLSPALERNFEIETIKNASFQDTVLFFIDPRRSDCTYYSSNTQLMSTIFDDDSGNNLQAKIALNARAKTIPYLIITSLYNKYLDSDYYLKISNLNTTLWDYL